MLIVFFLAQSNHSSVNTNPALCTLKIKCNNFGKVLIEFCLVLHTAVYVVCGLNQKVCVHFQCLDEKIKGACFYEHRLAKKIFVEKFQEISSLFSFLKVVKFNLSMAPSIREHKCL